MLATANLQNQCVPYYFSRANGAKHRSGRKPGARVTNSASAFTYIQIMRSYIAQWHIGIEKSSSILDLDVGRISLFCACASIKLVIG